ncbi:MAG: LPP20 family lipoprotein [Bacteroidetes bacterium]|nr:LPP20 family lipoprotein [Bacteroidota bacterium]MBU1114436.1 LPP20 family lipoprotein [Bacteroidota bacterium]MBU1799784.1 LPP20 family lipoprotein [Bacteroidota bacterium]
MKNRKLLLILLLVFFSNCIAQTSSDVYVNLEKDFPDSRYLAAVGEGDSRNEAEKNAMAKLALIFESKIDVNQTLNEHYSEFSDDENSSLTYEAKTTKRTNVESDQKLLNVKYGKHSVDNNGNNYAVAYINRSETAFVYEEKIANNNSSIFAMDNSAEMSDSKIYKYAAYNRASEMMNENIGLMKQLSIISPHTSNFSDQISKYESIYHKKGNVANSIKFVVSNESNKDVVNSLSSLLTSKGFKIAESGDFLITSSMKYEKVNLGRKEIFYNWFVNVELKNAEEEIIFNFEKSSREGGISESAVLARTKYSANESLKMNFMTEFQKYLNSLLGN